MKKKVILLGATGLIGSHVLDILGADDFFDEVKVLVRRGMEVNNPKVSVQVIDFEDPDQFRNAMQGADIVFCAIGTTSKKVKGNREAYRKVDYTIPVQAAAFGKAGGCQQFAVVSSMGADSQKSNFYLKLKGEVEDEISQTGIASLHIFRPSLLLGKRGEKRVLEDIGQLFIPVVGMLLPKQFKPIAGKTVAQAMVDAVKENKKGRFVYGYKEMKEFKNIKTSVKTE